MRASAMVAVALAGLAAPTSVARADLAPFAGAVNVVPAEPTAGNCVPFGNNVDFGFSGFIYRNIPAFKLQPGTVIAFDLGGTNDVDVRRDIYFSAADHNPAPGNGNVRATGWTKIVSDTQVPSSPRGNTIVGDYELRYRSEGSFSFGGGGLVIGFGASPPSSYRDGGCEQVGVTGSRSDTSGRLYARFWGKPDRDLAFLDRVTSTTTFISGFVVFTDITPPVVSATVSPAPGTDGWVDTGGDAVTVSWSGVDEASGIASCDAPSELLAELVQPGTYELTGRCTDGAGNVGATTITVRIARRVEVEVMPQNKSDPLNANRRGPATFTLFTTQDFDASRTDIASLRFGVTGNEPSVRSCEPNAEGLRCRFDVAVSGVADVLLLKGFSDGIRVTGSDEVRVPGPR